MFLIWCAHWIIKCSADKLIFWNLEISDKTYQWRHPFEHTSVLSWLREWEKSIEILGKVEIHNLAQGECLYNRRYTVCWFCDSQIGITPYRSGPSQVRISGMEVQVRYTSTDWTSKSGRNVTTGPRPVRTGREPSVPMRSSWVIALTFAQFFLGLVCLSAFI